MSPPFIPLHINGQSRPSSTGETFDVCNPYSSTVAAVSASASSLDCKEAIESAGKAFLTWEHIPVAVKRDIFIRAADLLATDKYKDELMAAAEGETASVQWWALFNWQSSVNALRTTAGMVSELRGESFPSGSVPGALAIVQRRAMGVVFSIAPWNAPVILSIRAVAIPILCGNTVVLKSSEYSPRSQAIVANVFHEAGLPSGVLNFISISRENSPRLTAEIIAHPLVRQVNFTGSDRVGKIIAGEAAKYLKPCVFELGGKAPVVVLNDAHIEEAAKAITFGAMAHSGQICMSTERVVVQRGAFPALRDAIVALCKTLKAGDPSTDPKVNLSALFSASSAENVVSMIREAKVDGAEVILGSGERDGAVVQPHLILGAKTGMRIWDRESFGPVIVFAVVDTVDEAVALANDSDYSLVAALWTRDVNTALDVAGRIRAGYTNVNGATIHGEPLLGHAGLGGATGYGRFDIDAFTNKRVIVVHPPGRKYPIVG